MIEVVIHGRGGGGGVTLAKLIAGVYFLRDMYVQAFGVYGAERSGAPVQAFVRADDEEITLNGPIAAPDHVIIIDPSLVSPGAVAGMKAGGWVVLNTAEDPAAFVTHFPGRRIATLDAGRIAVANRLGSAALPIVNTTVLGAVVKLFGLEFADAEAALAAVKFGGPNVDAARAAFEQVRVHESDESFVDSAPPALPKAYGFFDEAAGSPPTTHTGEWASRRPASRQLTAVCNDACPAGNDVRGFLEAAARQDYTEALATVLATSPFPGVCGRVCPAPCMSACNRAALDGAVNIREVERAVEERGDRPAPVRPGRPERIAVVGSGPAGLSAAYHLTRAGFPVTVFEAASEIGGVLRTGIPAYRLPRDVLDREIAFIAAQGVEMKTDHPADREEVERLGRDYAAVFVATGLGEPRDLDLGGGPDGRVVQGLEFLDQARHGGVSLSGEDVIVIGGGNTAMDAARSAVRLGARDVRVVYRRSRSEMPAIAEEIDEALEERVGIQELVAPVRVEREAQRLSLVCRRMALGEPDESGRRRPVPLDGDDALLPLICDRVLLALGQSPDLSILPAGTGADGRGVTGDRGPALVLAGGDLTTGEGTVAAAIGSGRAAAARIVAALTGMEEERPESPPLAGPDVVAVDRFPREPARACVVLPVDERCSGFAEVRRGLVGRAGEEDAVGGEAARCLSCGSCNACETCVTYCPEGILHCIEAHACDFDLEYCKGCGLCAALCPRGAIVMRVDSEAVRS